MRICVFSAHDILPAYLDRRNISIDCSSDKKMRRPLIMGSLSVLNTESGKDLQL